MRSWRYGHFSFEKKLLGFNFTTLPRSFCQHDFILQLNQCIGHILHWDTKHIQKQIKKRPISWSIFQLPKNSAMMKFMQNERLICSQSLILATTNCSSRCNLLIWRCSDRSMNPRLYFPRILFQPFHFFLYFTFGLMQKMFQSLVTDFEPKNECSVLSGC